MHSFMLRKSPLLLGIPQYPSQHCSAIVVEYLATIDVEILTVEICSTEDDKLPQQGLVFYH